LDQFAFILDIEDNQYFDATESKQFDAGLLARIKLFLHLHANPKCLAEQFLHLDIKNEGT
jgi:hypothetical protein